MRFVFGKNPCDNNGEQFPPIEDYFDDEMADEIDVDFFDEEEDI